MEHNVTGSLLRGFAFALTTAVLTVLLAFGAAAVVQSSGQEQVEQVRDATALTAKYLSAIGCELAVPADPDTGRNPRVVASCFRIAGVEVPTFLNP